MPVAIKEISTADDKSKICEQLLRALPEWFGNEVPILEYAQGVREKPFYAAIDNDTPIGFVSVHIHNPHTSEIYVMGILKTHHKQGIGKKLVDICVNFCQSKSIEFLTVKTLDESAEYEYYDRTRKFYLAMGFKPLQVFPLHWDADNPCLLMVKHINKKVTE
jgi:ribosomal protein S18 acetylase RimI-like enzyme